MEPLVDYLSANPLYAAGIAALILLFLFALVKKMLKVAILAIALNLAYVYYLQDAAEKAYATTGAKVERAMDKAGDLFNDAGELIK